MQSFVKQAAIKVYGAGIVINNIYSIYDQNKIIQHRQENDSNIDRVDYARYSVIGLMSGAFTGLFWPITAIGQCTLAIDKILAASNNN
jgi:hypothetical protein